MLEIIALNANNEPFDIQHINVNEQVFFFYGADSSTSFLNLNGSEKWVWNFDYGYVGISDQNIQTITNFTSPISTSFTRTGFRTVSVSVYDINNNLIYTATLSFTVSSFPTFISGPDYAVYNSTVSFSVNTTAQTIQWYIGGVLQTSTTNTLTINPFIVQSFITCTMINGIGSVSLTKTCSVSLANSVYGQKYEGNVTPDLMFFNKEGDNLNFELIQYNDGTNSYSRWEGDLIFNPNGNDTFKTIGLYILENVPPISFPQDPSNMLLRKFQLFNERGIDFETKHSGDIYIEDIQAVNTDTNFYSKWIIAHNIHLSIPIGSEIYFQDVYSIDLNSNGVLLNYELIPDFNPTGSTSGGFRTYTVFDSKKDAILIVTDTSNSVYSSEYGTNGQTYQYGYGQFRLSNNTLQTVIQGRVVCSNIIKIFEPELLNSEWNEPDYQVLINNNKKINVINSQKNDGVYTVTYLNSNPSNAFNKKYIKIDSVSINDLIPNPRYGFKVDLNFKTNRIFLSTIPVDFLPASTGSPFLNMNNFLVWEMLGKKDYTPGLLKTGVPFFFVQTDPVNSNFSINYEVLNVGISSSFITPQSDDQQGWRLTLLSYHTMSNSRFEIIINRSVYIFIEGRDFSRGIDINESAFNLGTVIQNKISELSILVQNNQLWIWVKTGFTFKTIIVPNVFSLSSGALIDTNPQYGIINDTWVYLNNTYFSGYIHYTKSIRTYNFLYFNGQDPVWYSLPDTKKVVVVNSPPFKFAQDLLTDCYLQSTTISLFQNIDNSTTSGVALVQKFIANNQNTLNLYGVEAYSDDNNIYLARMRTVNTTSPNSDYINIVFYKDNTLNVLNSGTAGTNVIETYSQLINNELITDIDLVTVEETLTNELNHIYGINENSNTTTEQWTRKIIIKNIDNSFGFLLNINGINYQVPMDLVDSIEVDNLLLSIEQTLKNWGNTQFTLTQASGNVNDTDVGKKYFEILESIGILTWLEKSIESYDSFGVQHYDTIVLQSKYPNVNIVYSVNGTFNEQKILHSDIFFNFIGNNLILTINNVQYSVANQGSISSTINQWNYLYQDTLFKSGIITDYFSGTNGTDSYLNMLRFSTLTETTLLTYQIWVGKNANLIDSLYTITSYREGNVGIMLTGNQINLLNGDFQSVNFSTGMIVSVSGSIYPLNNQQYNIIYVDPNILELSYQGPFWDSTKPIISDIINRSSFDWYLEDVSTPQVGINAISDPTFINGTSWWTPNGLYYINNNTFESSENTGFESPNIEIVDGYYNISYTSISSTSGHFNGSFDPAMLKIFEIVSPNVYSKVYEYDPSNFGTYNLTTYLSGGIIYISFFNELSNNYIAVQNVSLVRLSNNSTAGELVLNTRDFLRYPRERYQDEGQSQILFTFSWQDNSDDSIFFYDFSGTQLNSSSGNLQYTGPIPVLYNGSDGYLNSLPNTDTTRMSDPTVQQTVFDSLNFYLYYLDDMTELSPLPNPMQVFIGFKSLTEGVSKKTLNIYRNEDVSVSLTTTQTLGGWSNIVKFKSKDQTICVENGDINFIDLGFVSGQTISITGMDISNSNNEGTFLNNGYTTQITQVFVNKLVLSGSGLLDDTSLKTTYGIIPPFRPRYSAMQTNITVVASLIGVINIKGQTEIEDERYKLMLNNFGYNIKNKDIFIFKEYDINESGIDWIFLNRKRKELLLTYPEIYNYIGSYKSLINAINYFGYNDLELYEYYLDNNIASDDYQRYHKVEISGIFDNTVSGWTEEDFIIRGMPDQRYEKTKLFNLTYRITDDQGNIILAYSLDEIITKILGLKTWLMNNIMTIGTSIKDITGRADTIDTPMIWHDNRQSTIFNMNETLTVIDFNIEAYLQPVVNNSMTYTVHLEFFTNVSDINIPLYYHLKISTFSREPDTSDPNFRLQSVQLINEYRTDLSSYNFVADKNIDPYIMVECSSDNNFGAVYTVDRTYIIN